MAKRSLAKPLATLEAQIIETLYLARRKALVGNLAHA